MTPIQWLPVELLYDIICLACCDGGLTACSLRLVSRAWRALTNPYQFRSVSFAGGPQEIQAFLRAFEASNAASRANLRHICLTTTRTNERDVLHRDLLKDLLSTVSPAVETLVFATER
ncbi:hypothetical protein NEOLEDRAFT_1127122 [Neolentinus lepideus HHB14362 ss-1]|uniref:F-box domain-containing protein n=1 Tax=Neolentinus lepideus HHB14362 ss-1 TaxID=1314782 RepID=A0A165VUC7_9AGAM|nr:hypothetical protein NEOLEDRAFT_1127122 [Neolentinus lepideus HHB14362 ss-1]